jgi:CDP-diacylglycerol--glycerol-3-phosphate 3-phosphatidyltransferase
MAKAAGVPGAGKQKARGLAGRVVDPVARGLLRLGISPDAITIAGTVGVTAASVLLLAQGHLTAGAAVIAVLALSDMLDGSMARQSGRSGSWGAFLDSTLDRIADAAVLGSLAFWYLGDGAQPVLGILSLICLAGGGLVSYARARAESLGYRAAGGVAERTERMVLILLTTGLAGLGVPFVDAVGLWVLAVAVVITVVQRMLAVRVQTREATAGPEGSSP